MTDTSTELSGGTGPVFVGRGAYGIAHIRASDEWDAWLGMGYAAAEDRLWQMEYDRRRGAGRWAEVAGLAALKADMLARRLRLTDAAKADIDAMSEATRRMFEAYASGVNLFIDRGDLPPEYRLVGIQPSQWTIEDAVLAFKVRHVLMGPWQLKLVQAIVAARAGLHALAAFDTTAPRGSLATLPPGARIERLYRQAEEDIGEAAEHLGFVSEAEAGSNAWVVNGSRTMTGHAILCNDSHRALDVPNVYWQARVQWPGVDIVGATFPGLPGFPHFGHNGRVGWAITHTGADNQDLYIEQFDASLRHRTTDGWKMSIHRTESIDIRGTDAMNIETFRTRHGTVVHGDPHGGYALALRYTGTDRPCKTFETFRPMVLARSVDELFAAQSTWVDPVNNLVAADDGNHIGCLTRGVLPIRSSRAHERLPAVGWTGEHEWLGDVPFEQMPRSIDPGTGWIATSNHAVLDAQDPYVAYSFAEPFRAERISERLRSSQRHTRDELAAMQVDTTSWVAQRWVNHFRSLASSDGDDDRARQLLASWDGDLGPSSAAALLYSCFRRCLARNIFEGVVGPAVWSWLTTTKIPAAGLFVRRGLAAMIWNELVRDRPDDSRTLRDAVPGSLADAWNAAAALAGPDPAKWGWAQWHQTRATHPLSRSFPAHARHFDPPSVGMGGDSDTPQTASYGMAEGSPFDVETLPVYRQVLDFADIAGATFVVPGGASGVPKDAHYVDQLALWSANRQILMREGSSAQQG